MSFWTTYAICQNTPTTNVPNDWLTNALKWIEKGKVDAQRVGLLNHIKDSLQGRVDNLLLLIKEQKDKVAALEIKETSYQNEIKNLNDAITILTKESKKLDKKLRRQKTATIITPILTAALTAAGFLFIK